MIYISSNNGINYNPRNTQEEIMTNITMILKVYKEETPLNRDFSLDSDLIDKNINKIQNTITAELIELLNKYEPRALLETVEIRQNDNYLNDFEIILGILI